MSLAGAMVPDDLQSRGATVHKNTTKIFGPPGTGKTTRLLGIVSDAMASGIPPERIAYVSFTKKAAHEAIHRSFVRFGFSQDRMPHFSTIHSMAFRQIGASRDEVMTRSHFNELTNSMGLKTSGKEDEYAHLPAGTLLGDKCIRIEALARLRSVSLRSQWEEENEYDCPFQAVDQWSRGLETYKESRGLMDYTDLLERYSGALDVDLFIVDEAQDLSPLQWKVVEQACQRSRRVYVAGDDDQCIYGWAGAEVNHFLGLPGKIEVLPKSFRLPTRLFELANQVSSRLRVRQPKDWVAINAGGEIRRVRYEDSIDFGGSESWLLLSRNRASLRRFERVLRSQGFPYLIDGKSSMDNSVVRSILTWERCRRGNPVSVGSARELGQFIAQEMVLPMKGEVVLSRALQDPALLNHNWMEALPYIPPEQREYIRACLANRESLTDAPRITVSTIHQAKGGEADNVVLIPDVSAKPYEKIDDDSEIRVLYVAVTRAKKTLTIVEPAKLRCFKI